MLTSDDSVDLWKSKFIVKFLFLLICFFIVVVQHLYFVARYFALKIYAHKSLQTLRIIYRNFNSTDIGSFRFCCDCRCCCLHMCICVFVGPMNVWANILHESKGNKLNGLINVRLYLQREYTQSRQWLDCEQIHLQKVNKTHKNQTWIQCEFCPVLFMQGANDYCYFFFRWHTISYNKIYTQSERRQPKTPTPKTENSQRKKGSQRSYNWPLKSAYSCPLIYNEQKCIYIKKRIMSSWSIW